jgi:hypothetical protein
MPRLTLIMARAAQRYGIIIRDYSGVVSFAAQDPQPGQPNPYGGPSGLYQGMYPNHLLASFPWSHLQVARMHLEGSR